MTRRRRRTIAAALLLLVGLAAGPAVAQDQGTDSPTPATAPAAATAPATAPSQDTGLGTRDEAAAMADTDNKALPSAAIEDVGRGLVFPSQASTFAPSIDGTWWYITGISVFFVVLIFGATVWFMIRYRSARQPEPEPAGHNNLLEIGWTVVPALLVFSMFILGFRGYMEMAVLPPNALKIQVNAQQWAFSYDYSINGQTYTYDTLVVPVNTPIELTLYAKDVIHAYYVPAFRVKKDMVPGRYNKMWFTATQLGEFPVYCTEYCGTGHSTMPSKVRVVTDAQYREALKVIGDPTLGPDGVTPLPATEVGAKFYKLYGCNTCHSVDGTSASGPTWKDLYYSQQPIVGQGDVLADDAFIKESILYPDAKIVQGYGNLMASYREQLDDAKLNYLIEYMKTLSKFTPAQPAGTVGEGASPSAPAVDANVPGGTPGAPAKQDEPANPPK